MTCYASLPGRRPLDDYTPIRQLYQSKSAAGVVSAFDWTGWSGTIKVTLASDGSTLFTGTIATPTTDGYLSYTPTTVQAALLTGDMDYDVQFTVTSAGGLVYPTPVMRMHVDPNI